MPAGETDRAEFLTADALDEAIAADLANPSKPPLLEIGDERLDVAAADPAHQWSADELVVKDPTLKRRRNAVRTTILPVPVRAGPPMDGPVPIQSQRKK